MKKTILLSVLFFVYACTNQGNERQESPGTSSSMGGDTTSIHDRPNNTGMEVSDTSTSIAHDTSARKPH